MDPIDSIERGRRIKILRVLANLDRKAVEEKHGINFNTLKGWELGRHGGLTEKGAKKIISMCQQEGVHCDLEWLLHAQGIGPSLYPSVTPLTAPSLAEQEKQILNEILFFRHQHPDATEYLIMDDSMLPFYLPGDYVCGIKRRAEQIETVLKKSCILELEAGKKIVRRIEEGSHPQRYNLHCSNPQHPQILHDVMLLSAAPIIWHRKKECFETERREIHEKHQK